MDAVKLGLWMAIPVGAAAFAVLIILGQIVD